MKAHPFTDYAYRWIPMLVVALALIVAQVALLWEYTGAEWVPAIIDGISTIGWFVILVYLAWFVVGFVSLFKTNIIVILTGILLWLSGSYIVYDIMERFMGINYLPFLDTVPFRLLFGIPAWIAVILGYHLLVAKETISQEDSEFVLPQKEPEVTEAPEEHIDRITVKDGSRIHLVVIDKLLYIQACGDYVTLITPEGEYIKEQTMKYFETHLPAENFVRIHRSTIVNVMQISRVELYGKETYRLILKNGVKLRVSLTGYKLLKERLGL